MCVDVQCGKTCCFLNTNHIAGGMLHQKTHDGFWPPFSVRRFLGKRYLLCPEHMENRRPERFCVFVLHATHALVDGVTLQRRGVHVGGIDFA